MYGSRGQELSDIKSEKISPEEARYKLLISKCKEVITWSANYEADILTSYSSSVDHNARAFAEELVSIHPNDPQAVGYYARSLVMEGRLEDAIAKFERAASLGDGHSQLVLGPLFSVIQGTRQVQGHQLSRTVSEIRKCCCNH